MKSIATVLLTLGTMGFCVLNTTQEQITDETLQVWFKDQIGFEENIGQVTDFEGKPVSDVLFRARCPGGYGIFLTKKGVSYVLYQRNDSKMQNIGEKTQKIRYARIDLELVNANISKCRIEYKEPLAGDVNYYLPVCRDGILGVKIYREIIIRDVYPGIDWVWRYEDGEMHHQFEVRPNAEINKIKIKVKWADYEIKEDGKKLIFSTPLGRIEDGEIVAYEDSQIVDVSYKIDRDGLVGFNVQGYSGKSPLIIDPPLSLLWATYYGGSGVDMARSITTDGAGNVFVTGWTGSTDFPTYNPGGNAYFQGTNAGGVDAFILKFNNSGVRLWATYYGGISFDDGYSITCDSSGNIFVTGYTNSTDFPTYNPGGNAYFQETLAGGLDAFILKFNNSGVRLWATYYGGSSMDDIIVSTTTDGLGNIFAIGYTGSTDFPTYNPGGGVYYQDTLGGGYYDAFILKFNNSGVRLWATYYGGNSDDLGYSITCDSAGNIFATGYTFSTDFPTYDPGGGAYYQGTYAGNIDAFILKFNNAGSRLWATYYGGSVSNDEALSITTDISGQVFVTGWTLSTNFPTYNPGGAYYQGSNAGGRDAFILKFNNSGVRLWATYYGGNSNDEGHSIITDRSGNVFVTGFTQSTNFPTYNPGGGAYFQGTPGGLGDLFILEFSNSGVRLWATYYGGNREDGVYSIAADGSGNAFITGYTQSTDFPTYNPGGGSYFQGTGGGNYADAFILKFESSIVAVEEQRKEGKTLLIISPNIFSTYTQIIGYENPVVIVYNTSGRIVGKYPVNRIGYDLPAGVYFVNTNNGNTSPVRVVKIR